MVANLGSVSCLLGGRTAVRYRILATHTRHDNHALSPVSTLHITTQSSEGSVANTVQYRINTSGHAAAHVVFIRMAMGPLAVGLTKRHRATASDYRFLTNPIYSYIWGRPMAGPTPQEPHTHTEVRLKVRATYTVSKGRRKGAYPYAPHCHRRSPARRATSDVATCDEPGPHSAKAPRSRRI